MIRAIIFDLDGTLADTEALHFESFRHILAELDIVLDERDYFSRLIGYADRECFELVLTEHRRDVDGGRVDALIERKGRHYQSVIAERDLLYPNADQFVRRAASRVPIALATGTLRAEAEMILRRAGLRELFDVVVAAEDVKHSKPAPDGFLLANELLNATGRFVPPLQPSQCLVIEDTMAGVKAARAAGMPVLAVTHTCSPDDLGESDLVVRSVGEADLNQILKFFGERSLATRSR